MIRVTYPSVTKLEMLPKQKSINIERLENETAQHNEEEIKALLLL